MSRTPAQIQADAQALERVVAITDALRQHCGWTARLTPQSLTPYLVEEAAEVAETVGQGRLGAPLASELGDVLFQILLHSRLAQERGDFDLADVADALSQKLLRRNTHVFAQDGSVLEHPDSDPEAAITAWQQAKAKERADRGELPVEADPLRGLPASLPALVLAHKALDRSAAPTPGDRPGDRPGRGDHSVVEQGESEERLGEELLALVARARAAGVDSERALRSALIRSLS
ncbi:MazG nucleotide pyrophosphohydrolase domain-containing protein [Galactobacter caseinivorans]|uniref:Nucleotide pyrophosphohydrolase n=1 Tax=Galactobacter caseinivorans TaxID=2676123 RepID=A0A496PJF2_9MICC|nr:MazG nucleotide pyrophosphohydrolase domain-containing protein [Galactobacter caseinivorans]RKW70597.1 nucleotide pyrophosphohydrolase [Galactobacter caseinivorans]